MRLTILTFFILLIGVTIGQTFQDGNSYNQRTSKQNLGYQSRKLSPTTENLENAENRIKRTPVDLDINPLLYTYYSGLLNPMYTKRDTRYQGKELLPRQISDLDTRYKINQISGSNIGKRDFDEIDRTSFTGFKKRFLTADNINDDKNKRTNDFDEIDRVSFSGFKRDNLPIKLQRLANIKRNFDEIDKVGFSGFK